MEDQRRASNLQLFGYLFKGQVFKADLVGDSARRLFTPVSMPRSQA
ncbi:MAG: hypothetical protein LBK08_01675 [Treponema sp.]|nr:hypothetical protein [Treponema sp.]